MQLPTGLVVILAQPTIVVGQVGFVTVSGFDTLPLLPSGVPGVAWTDCKL